MTRRTVLITEAIGTVSSAVISALAAADVHLRALVRDEARGEKLRQGNTKVGTVTSGTLDCYPPPSKARRLQNGCGIRPLPP